MQHRVKSLKNVCSCVLRPQSSVKTYLHHTLVRVEFAELFFDLLHSLLHALLLS